MEMSAAAYVSLSPTDLDNFENPLRLPGPEGPMGVLDASEAPVRMVARYEEMGIVPGKRTGMFVYRAEHGGRSYTNPLLRVRRGERFAADFENGLDEDSTIHWHGLRLDWRMDGHPLRSVRPGGTYRYDFPVANPGGTYWYHPHAHEATALQTYAGMSGLFLIEDEDERRLAEALDLRLGETDIPLVIQDRTFDESGGLIYEPDEMYRFMGVTGDTILVNLTPTPYLEVDRGTYRFRLLNGSNARIYRLAFVGEGGEVLPHRIVATDGVLLDRPRLAAEMFLAPGERADVLLDLSVVGAGETVTLRSLHFDPMHNEHEMAEGEDHHMGPARLGDGDGFYVLKLAVTGGARRVATTSLPLPAAPGPSDAGGEPDRVFTLSADMGEAEAAGELAERSTRYTCPMHPEVLRDEPGSCPICGMNLVPGTGESRMRWLINGLTYDVEEFPIEVRRAAREVWEIRNEEKSMPHPMHLHGFHFRVLSRTGSPGQISRLAVDEVGRTTTDLGEKDTVVVWPGEKVRVSVDFSHGFEGEQTYLFHCHVLEHEDQGMMINFKVA